MEGGTAVREQFSHKAAPLINAQFIMHNSASEENNPLTKLHLSMSQSLASSEYFKLSCDSRLCDHGVATLRDYPSVGVGTPPAAQG